MKISEAILVGSLLSKQDKFSLVRFGDQKYTCVLGAALDGVGKLDEVKIELTALRKKMHEQMEKAKKENNKQLSINLPSVYELIQRIFPEFNKPGKEAIMFECVNRNDTLGQSREEIAQWLSEIGM